LNKSNKSYEYFSERGLLDIAKQNDLLSNQ